MIWMAVTGLAGAALAGLGAVLIWAMGRVVNLLAPVLWPLAVAGVIAYLLDPVVDLLERRRVPRVRAIACVFGVALVLVAILFGSVVPQLVRETRQFATRVPAYVTGLQTRIEGWMSQPPAFLQRFLERETAARSSSATGATTNSDLGVTLTNAPADASQSATNTSPSLAGSFDQGTIETATDWLAKIGPSVGKWFFGQVGALASWFGVLAGLALVPVYAFYFLLEKRSISTRWANYLPVADSRFKEELVFVLNAINNYLIAFFRGQVLVAMCDGVLYTIGFLVIGLPYALLIGVMAVALTMIPFIGAIVICLTALVLALVRFGDWSHPLMVLVVFALVQTTEGLFVSPRIMGGRVGLHPLAIIIAVMVGTTLLGGLLGGILAIPLTAALRVVMARYVWHRPADHAKAG